MDTRFIAIAVPVFFSAIGLELLINRRRGDPMYRFHDSIANLACGVGQQIVGVLGAALLAYGYIRAYDQYRFFDIPMNAVWGWVAALVLVDFFYYWLHRSTHRINVLWASHIVHHQSEELNLAVALRQSWLQGLFSMFFYFPLAVLGFPVEVTLTAIALNAVGQFWFHTRRISRMGWLEWVLNTPSHHRVHHARNPRYLDRNYAGVLIIWDRLFGTFTPEEEEPVYGTVKPLHSWNVVWANVHYWIELARLSVAAPSWKQKILVWFLPPGELGGVRPPRSDGSCCP